MYTKYPTSIDTSNELPLAVDNQTPVKAEVVNRLREAVLSIENELGADPSREYGTVRARLDAMEDGSGGGSGYITLLEDGTLVASSANSINFTGGVSLTQTSPTEVEIAVEGGQANQIQESITPTNGQTAFTLSQEPIQPEAVQFFINGLKYRYGTEYTVSGNILTYLGSPSVITTDIIEFWYLVDIGGIGGGSGTISILDNGSVIDADTSSINFIGGGTTITQVSPGSIEIEVTAGSETIQVQQNIAPTDGQTVFTLTETPVQGNAVQFFINGLKYEYTTDYTVSATTLTYIGSTPIDDTDTVQIWYLADIGSVTAQPAIEIQNDGYVIEDASTVNYLTPIVVNSSTPGSVDISITTSVASIAALLTLDDVVLNDGAAIFVVTLQDFFTLNKSSTFTIDNITVAATQSGTGRWIRTCISNLRWQSQAEFWVDESTGDDENPGTEVAPIASLEEWARRTDQTSTAGQTLWIVGGTTTSGFEWNAEVSLSRGITVRAVRGTPLFSGTVSGAQAWNGAASTDHRITASSLPTSWTASDLISKLIVRVSDGAVGRVLTDLGSRTARITPLVDENGDTVFFGNGDTFNVYPNVVLEGQQNIGVEGQGANLRFHDLVLGTLPPNVHQCGVVRGSAIFIACWMAGFDLSFGAGCATVSSIVGQIHAYENTIGSYVGSHFTGPNAVIRGNTALVGCSSEIQLQVLDGASIQIEDYFASFDVTNAMYVENSAVKSTGYLFGTGVATSGGQHAIVCGPRSDLIFDPTKTPNYTGAANVFKIGNVTKTFAQLPFSDLNVNAHATSSDVTDTSEAQVTSLLVDHIKGVAGLTETVGTASRTVTNSGANRTETFNGTLTQTCATQHTVTCTGGEVEINAATLDVNLTSDIDIRNTAGTAFLGRVGAGYVGLAGYQPGYGLYSESVGGLYFGASGTAYIISSSGTVNITASAGSVLATGYFVTERPTVNWSVQTGAGVDRVSIPILADTATTDATLTTLATFTPTTRPSTYTITVHAFTASGATCAYWKTDVCAVLRSGSAVIDSAAYTTIAPDSMDSGASLATATLTIDTSTTTIRVRGAGVAATSLTWSVTCVEIK